MNSDNQEIQEVEYEEVEVLNPLDFGLTVDQAKEMDLQKSFQPKIDEREVLAIEYKRVISLDISKDTCEEAKALRNQLVKVRTGISKIHKSQKDFFWSAGKLVDAWKNKETEPVTQMEDKLKEIENHFQEIEDLRVEAVYNERQQILVEYKAAHIPHDLGMIDANVWEAMKKGAKLLYEANIKEEEEAKEARRLEKEKQKIHNERNNFLLPLVVWIKCESEINWDDLSELSTEDYEKRLSDARSKKKESEAEVERLRAKEQEKQEEEDRRIKVIEDKAEEKRATDQKKIDDLSDKLAKEKADKEQKEREETEAEEKRLSMGDADKKRELIEDLRKITTKFSFKSKRNNKLYDGVIAFIHMAIKLIG